VCGRWEAVFTGLCQRITALEAKPTNLNQPTNRPTSLHHQIQAAYSKGRIYLADRTDVTDPPAPPAPNSGPINAAYNPRPAVYWAWVQPTFTAYGPCSCYWNFNWGWAQSVGWLVGWLVGGGGQLNC
jgi:hypothetical protein